jgi:hypothetical protein
MKRGLISIRSRATMYPVTVRTEPSTRDEPAEAADVDETALVPGADAVDVGGFDPGFFSAAFTVERTLSPARGTAK